MKNQKSQPNNFFTTSDLEQQLLAEGHHTIIGIDEVGRGAWAGPVVVAGYVFSNASIVYPQVTDSKLLNPRFRAQLNQNLQLGQYLIIEGSVEQINKYGVGRVITNLIMQIINSFKQGNSYFLIDGVFKKDFGPQTQKIIKGDQKHYSIACASIVAKEYRDNMMRKLHQQYPQYSFDSNVGYGTRHHRQKIAEQGICQIHRTSFKPIGLIYDQLKIL